MTRPRLGLWLVLILAACAPGDPPGKAAPPNILWIVWDTARADRMSLYGFPHETTPFLDTWATGARVFEDCISTANATVASHASMFTGLLPSEHGANNSHKRLDDEYETAAEMFSSAGWSTYLYSANPLVSLDVNLSQGFHVEEHPYDPERIDQAAALVRAKIHKDDRSTSLPRKLRRLKPKPGLIKASGALAGPALLDWLDTRAGDGPWFAFLNYMEAHRPYVPPEALRRQLLEGDDLRRSYELDLEWLTIWRYTFSLQDYSERDLRILRAVYAALFLELDAHLRDLVISLERRGALENTIVVLTADHGEHLGEHHMLDHQFSVYDSLIRVPLVLRAPGRVEPGRDARACSTLDILPTLLELAEIRVPPAARRHGQSLLAPPVDRTRVAEYPADFEPALRTVEESDPGWDSAPWRRSLRALLVGQHKLIVASDGGVELYDRLADPLENDDLSDSAAELLTAMAEQLDALALPAVERTEATAVSAAQAERLRALGYLPPEAQSAPE